MVQPTQCVMLGDEDGNNPEVSPGGSLQVYDEGGMAIAKGDVAGTSFIHKFGEAPSFSTVDGVVSVWDGADENNIDQMVYQYSSTADIDRLSSSSAGDTQDIEVQGLGAGYVPVTQTVTLTGQTPVALTTPLLRVFRLKNVNSTDNAGHVYCFVDGTVTAGVPNTPADVRAVIQPGNNQTLMAIYTVPAGYTGYMRDYYVATAGASRSSEYPCQLRARPEGQVFQLKHKIALQDGGTTYLQHIFEEPEVFAEKTDLEIRVASTAGGATGVDISGGFDIVLVVN